MTSETPETESSQEVSGQAAFWILSTLAVAAVAQPSTSSRRTGRDSIDRNIDLLRCFPGVCLLDALIDLVILGRAIHQEFSRPKPVHHVCQRVLPKASVLTVKLALSIFAVLPQIIKVLSMSGVPATQFCAFVFFLANMTNLAVELCGLGTDEHYTVVWDDFTTLLLLLVLMVQLFFDCWIWSNIAAPLAYYHLPAAVENVCFWLQALCSLAILTQLIIWVMRYFVYRRLDVSTSPNMVPMHVVIGLALVLGALRGPPMPVREPESGISPPPSPSDHAIFTMELVLCAGLASNIVAKTLDALSKLIPREADESSSNTQSAPLTVAQEGDTERESGSNRFWPLLKISVHWMWTLGTRIDSWIVPVFDVDSKATVTISLAVFSLITTVCYYLVWFDGTGTVNPGWTSILG